MVIAILLLVVLFLAGYLHIFYFPSKKLYARIQSFSFFFNSNINSSSSTCTKDITTSQVSKKEKNSCTSYDSNKKSELKNVFATFDKNGDGFITKQELRDSLKNIRIFLTEREVEEMVMKVDSNGDGLIDFEEFCLLCESMAMSSDQEREKERESFEKTNHDQGRDIEGELKEAFDVFDRDKDGLISVEELGLVLSSLGLNQGKKVEACKEMIKKVDMDGDGMVNFDEFKKMMKSGSTKIIPVF